MPNDNIVEFNSRKELEERRLEDVINHIKSSISDIDGDENPKIVSYSLTAYVQDEEDYVTPIFLNSGIGPSLTPLIGLVNRHIHSMIDLSNLDIEYVETKNDKD